MPHDLKTILFEALPGVAQRQTEQDSVPVSQQREAATGFGDEGVVGTISKEKVELCCERE